MNRVSRYLIWHQPRSQFEFLLRFTSAFRVLCRQTQCPASRQGEKQWRGEVCEKEIDFIGKDDHESTDLAMIMSPWDLLAAKMQAVEQYLLGVHWNGLQHPRDGPCHSPSPPSRADSQHPSLPGRTDHVFGPMAAGVGGTLEGSISNWSCGLGLWPCRGTLESPAAVAWVTKQVQHTLLGFGISQRVQSSLSVASRAAVFLGSSVLPGSTWLHGLCFLRHLWHLRLLLPRGPCSAPATSSAGTALQDAELTCAHPPWAASALCTGTGGWKHPHKHSKHCPLFHEHQCRSCME